ncbi:MAG TPA: hypothetical protein VEA69_09585 [Tepidisphaeraceae bacterium]|nr:hypothetical protein [Tepidisphaeraceae bacterium]
MQAVNTFGWFKELLAARSGPCVSVYMPTPRSAPPGDETMSRFRNLVARAEAELGRLYDVERVRAIVGKLAEAGADQNLWEGHREALAFFVSEDLVRTIEVRKPVEEFVGVADSFHVKPLIRALQSGVRYHVLCVGMRTVRLFEGDETELRGVKLDENVPRAAGDPLVTQANSTSPGVNQVGQPSAPTGSATVDRYFRLLDQAIWERYSRREQIPVIVCADVQFLSHFLAQSKNDYVVKEGIALNPDAATPERLRDEAMKILGPQWQRQIEQVKDAYQAARARRLGSDELVQVAEAAAVGRVGTLLVDSDAKVPAILHRHSGLLEPAPLDDPRADDVLDDLAEMVLQKDGQVFVIPHEQMPTDQGVAAVYRY